LRESKKRELSGVLPDDFGYSSRALEVRKVGLEALVCGVVLEHAYDPKRISEEDMDGLLRSVFDFLIQPEPGR
jgi:hypothetical protein